MNILITSGSRKVSLVRSFQKALKQEGGGKVIAVDITAMASSLYFADDHFLVPPSKDPEFLYVMLSLCKEQNIKLLIPTRDKELPLFAENLNRFKTIGTFVMVPNISTVKLCQDKKSFINFCSKNGFLTPAIFNEQDCSLDSNYPLFVKPRFGSRSTHAMMINTKNEFDLALKQISEPIIQEFVVDEEFTIDLFADFSGKVISAVPRHRINVMDGESFISKTCNNATLIHESAKLAVKLHLIGHNTIQCFFKNNRVKFIEVNPRFGGAANLGIAAGANTPLYLIKLLKGEELKPVLGNFKNDYIMLRYTDDLFIEVNFLTKKKYH